VQMFAVYHTLIYQPLYNGLIFLLDTVPLIDAGIAVILFTLIIKVILFPLSKKFISTQLAMKEIQPEVNALKEKYKDDKQEQARKMMELYKIKGVNPFSGIVLILIQIPILLALYRVFNSGLPAVNAAELYSLVSVPASVNMLFLGLFDISVKKNIILAALVAVSQFFQARFLISGRGAPQGPAGSFESDFARSMNVQTQYVLPLFIGFISYNLSGALAIYWVTSNLFAIGQEVYMRRLRKG
jgi:YidC/Oxa1 family membrane protein insertase